MHRKKVARPERKTAIVATEQRRYCSDIAALSKMRLTEEASLTDTASEYTIFWKTKPINEDRIHGIGYAVKTALLKNIRTLPSGFKERIMKFRSPLNKTHHITIVSAYAPSAEDANSNSSMRT